MIIQTSKLIEMRERGMTFSQVGSAVGLTKNAVVGRVWREQNPERVQAHTDQRREARLAKKATK